MDTKPYNPLLQGLVALSSFDIQPQQQQEKLADFTRMAATIAGSSYVTINILDANIQWTVAAENMATGQLARTETICQYTIDQRTPLEIKDLATHPSYQHLAFVKQHPELRYYLGIPILTELGSPIGVLCILDKNNLDLSANTVSVLQMLANQILQRLRLNAQLDHAHLELSKKKLHILKLAHDIRSPLNGMIGLSQMLGNGALDAKETIAKIAMLKDGMISLLNLANDSLAEEIPALHHQNGVTITLEDLALQVEQLHLPQALSKNVKLVVDINASRKKEVLFKLKLLQIASNLVSNAIKFTPENGTVRPELDILDHTAPRSLEMIVADSGAGLQTDRSAENIEEDESSSEKGTGLGLSIVQMLVQELEGTIEVNSKPGYGTTFRVVIPQAGVAADLKDMV